MGLGVVRDGLAPTPPMGWNSWNRFKEHVDERIVREHAEALVASGMRDLGYRTLVIDDGWHAAERGERGELVADPRKFPSGVRALADAAHALDLRFGIYLDAGARTCFGLPGSLGYEFRDARQLAEWGVDFVKIDWCHTEGLAARAVYEHWCEAILAADRPIVLSICEWGRSRPWTWAATSGHLWRTCWDIQDTWESFTTILDRQVELHAWAGPDHWNDPDMLEVGNGGMSATEYRSHFSLWAMLAAPLFAGNDLRAMPEEIREILAAPEVVALDQDLGGRQARRIRSDGVTEVWTRKLGDGRERAACLFNRDERPREIALAWTDLGWDAGATARVRDLWAQRDLGAITGGYAAEVAPHGVALVRLAP